MVSELFGSDWFLDKMMFSNSTGNNRSVLKKKGYYSTEHDKDDVINIELKVEDRI